MCIADKCKGIVLVVAGVLLGLVALGYFGLTWFFAAVLVVLGVHSLTCKECQALKGAKGKKK
ncbi:hypothetical protein GOV08_00805 [Candidatus Woesearchaeota archaeon]|nr:hypothetical protein [Candidatus Woesearchaeota archaeon]